jgi:hypothetical protein
MSSHDPMSKKTPLTNVPVTVTNTDHLEFRVMYEGLRNNVSHTLCRPKDMGFVTRVGLRVPEGHSGRYQ